MIYDWLANRGCLFPGESSIKINVFTVRWEKRSDVHNKDKRIRKEIIPRTKPSPGKVSHSEKLNKIEKLPNTSIDCPSNTTKMTISLYKYIVCIVTPLCFNKQLLIVNGDFFLSLSCQHPGNLLKRPTPTVKKSSGEIMSSPICGSSNQRGHRGSW